MGKSILTFAILFCFVLVSSLSAQYARKGVIELGGQISFSSTTFVSDGETLDDSQTNFSFLPQFGYFLVNNIELVLVPVFSSTSYGDMSSSSYGILFMPTYVFKTQGNLYPYLAGMVGYNSMTSENKIGGNTVESTSSGLSYGAQGGVKIQVGNSALINFGILYQMRTMEDEDWKGDRNGTNVLGIAAGVSIFLGK
jgi:hypothetical protein